MAEIPGIAALPAPYPPASQNGAVVGGVLRPGAIDQSQFQEQLLAQYKAQHQGKTTEAPKGMTLADYRKLAGVQVASAPTASPANAPGADAAKPVRAPAVSDGIPTLSLAQFAALTGLTLPESPQIAIPPSSGTAAIQLATSPVEITDATSEDVVPPDATPVDAASAAVPAVEEPVGLADGVPVLDGSGDAPTATGVNSRVVMLDTYPDREEQRSLAAQGKTWRMKETPGARELFLGPDGKFGWDDFVDIINPLQHIPVVAQIYRAVTGDQAYGLSAFLGAVPFGPLSVASAVADTVIRAQTGRDAGTDMAARIFGIDNRTPEEADLHLGRRAQPELADASSLDTGSSVPLQVADASAAQRAATGTAWTRDSAGINRD